MLSGALDIRHAAAAKRALLEAIAGHPRVELVLSGLVALDAAGIQLLILCRQEARRHGQELVLGAHGAAVAEQLKLFNLAALFGDRPISSDGHAGRESAG